MTLPVAEWPVPCPPGAGVFVDDGFVPKASRGSLAVKAAVPEHLLDLELLGGADIRLTMSGPGPRRGLLRLFWLYVSRSRWPMEALCRLEANELHRILELIAVRESV